MIRTDEQQKLFDTILDNCKEESLDLVADTLFKLMDSISVQAIDDLRAEDMKFDSIDERISDPDVRD